METEQNQIDQIFPNAFENQNHTNYFADDLDNCYLTDYSPCNQPDLFPSNLNKEMQNEDIVSFEKIEELSRQNSKANIDDFTILNFGDNSYEQNILPFSSNFISNNPYLEHLSSTTMQNSPMYNQVPNTMSEIITLMNQESPTGEQESALNLNFNCPSAPRKSSSFNNRSTATSSTFQTANQNKQSVKEFKQSNQKQSKSIQSYINEPKSLQDEIIINVLQFLVNYYNNTLQCQESADSKRISVKGKKKILKCPCQRCLEMNIITDHKFSKLKNLRTFGNLVESNERIKYLIKEYFLTQGQNYLEDQYNSITKQINEILYN